MNTNKVLLVVALIVVVGGGALYFKSNGSDGVVVNPQPKEDHSGEITVEGSISCLPYKAATAGQGCVKSIKGDDGKNYALDSIAVGGAELTMAEGTKVSAMGVFQKADVSVNDSSVFVYDGVLVLKTLKTR